ncbi:MAG: nickel pincer cofactor biosynthesis protein LarC [Candidatus Latescibacterota bacterium]
MNKVLLIDPFSGASGDMLLSSMISLGVPFEHLWESLSAIPILSRVKIREKKVKRGLFEAVQLEMDLPHEHEHRSLTSILDIIDASGLTDAIRKGSRDTFRRFAEAEAKVHGSTVEKVHFHEVGALDAIIDIVGFHSALAYLAPQRCFYRDIPLGSGSVTCEHGEIPLPAPATLELLTGHRVRFTERKEELVTPTAAALIASVFEALPGDALFFLGKIGYGAGTRDSGGMPNVLRAMLGDVAATPRRVCIITSTIDDMNPELYGFVMEKLFAIGALEVYYNSIMMKKNRPGLEMTIITEEADLDHIAQFVLSNTTTLGLRVNREERVELRRERTQVDTPFGPVDIKVGHLADGKVKISPEYESCRKAAEQYGVPLMDVFDAARIAWRTKK